MKKGLESIKGRLRLSLCVLVCAVLVLQTMPIAEYFSVASIDPVPAPNAVISYAPHAPINIANDAELEALAVEGNGSMSNPFILEGWNITTDNTEAVVIEDTTKYFVLQDCWIDAGGNAADGVYIQNHATNTTVIKDLYVRNTRNGIRIASDNSSIIGCVVENCRIGILSGAEPLLVSDCVCINNENAGFYSKSFDGLSLENCVFSNTSTSYGIWMESYGSNNNATILNCTIENNALGGIWIDTWLSSFPIIEKNRVLNNHGDGIYICGYSSTETLTIKDNLVEGNEGVGIYAESLETGVPTVSILNNTIISNTGYGIQLSSCLNPLVINNTVEDNAGPGIVNQQTDGSFFNNNTFRNNEFGLKVTDSSLVTFLNNSLVNDGLLLDETDLAIYNTYTIENNLVDGKPLGYLCNEENSSKSGFGQVIMVNCTNSETFLNHISNIEYGITVLNCHNCTIRDLLIESTTLAGIKVFLSDNITLHNTVIAHGEEFGISLDSCTDVEISGSNISENQIAGIELTNTQIINISHNTINQNSRSILIDGSSDLVSITNNTFSATLLTGLELLPGLNLIVANNDFVDDGIVLTGSSVAEFVSYNGKILENLVNGKPLGVYTNLNGATIEGPHGQLVLINTTDTSIVQQNCSHTADGISLIYCDNCSVTQSECSHCKLNGVFIHRSNRVGIDDCICSEGTGSGISLYESQASYVKDSEFNGNANGISLERSDYILIDGNTAWNNTESGLLSIECVSITIDSSDFRTNGFSGVTIDKALNTAIRDNICKYNSMHGIYLTYSSDSIITGNDCSWNDLEGLRLEHSTEQISDTITVNLFSLNGRCGVYAEAMYGLEISANAFHENLYYGLYLYGCEYARVFRCIFIGNNQDQTQAFDSLSTASSWFDALTARGNYWSDLKEEFYFIDGATGAVDYYPLNSTDFDHDNLNDTWEIINGLNPFFDDSLLDFDSDGLSNLEEYLLGTNLWESDSDFDLQPDAWEVQYGLDPLADDAEDDLDGDTLSNYLEFVLGLDPSSIDSDGDEMPDNWELENYLNPLVDDAALDPDGDGRTNIEEYQLGSNPFVSDAVATATTTTTTTGEGSPLVIMAIGATILGAVVVAAVLYLRRK